MGTSHEGATKARILKIAELGRMWTMIDSSITGIVLFQSILFFFGYAIYSAAHHVRF